jgi:hypothetical protein
VGSRSRRRRLCAPLAAALALGALPALAATPLVHRVSDLGIANGDVAATPVAAAPRFSPDGEWVVWTQDALVNEGWNLYAARRWDGSAPVLLSAAYPTGQGLMAFAVTPDSRRVVYLAGTFASGLFELLSAPIDGSAPAVVLSPTPPAGGVAFFELTPDGSRAVLVGDLRVIHQFELWSVPVAGPAGDAVRLNPNPAVPGQDVEAFAVSPDSQRVAFTGVLRGNGFDEVWSAPLAGPPPATPVSPVGSAGALGVLLGPTLPLAFSNDGARVLFAGDFQTPGTVQLWTNTNAGGQGAADTLNGLPTAGGDVVAFALAPGANRAVFLADLLVDEKFELFSALVDGSGTTPRLSPTTLPADGDVTDFRIGPGGSPQVYFRVDATTDQAFDLYRSPIAGGGATRLNDTTVATRSLQTDFAAAPDGSRVVFRGNFDAAGKIELYSAPGTGAAGSANRISRTPTPAGATVAAFAIASTSAAVVYAGDLQTAGRSELWSVPIAGGASAKLHPDAGANENVSAFALAPGGAEAAFLADLVVNDRFDLWLAPLTGSAPAAPVAVTAVTNGDVALPLVWSGEGHGVVFLGDLETDERFLLWDADTLIFRADFEEGDDSEWSAAVG